MPDPEVSVLLRNCEHNSTQSDATRIRYALQCDNMSIQIAKTPIQIPIPQKSPELIDLGIFRPSISINGIVPTIGENALEYTAGYVSMARFGYTRPDSQGTDRLCYYYFPYKNKLEETAYKWIASSDTDLELEIGNAEKPIASASGSTVTESTGGGIYKVAIQQCRFQVDASREDRWTFALQFVCKSRDDVSFS